MTKELNTMTVGELRDLLSCHDEDTLVVTECPTHDYWGSVLGGEINDLTDERVRYTAYHEAFEIVDSDKEVDEAEVTNVLVLC